MSPRYEVQQVCLDSQQRVASSPQSWLCRTLMNSDPPITLWIQLSRIYPESTKMMHDTGHGILTVRTQCAQRLD
jgi:hypothetical protein